MQIISNIFNKRNDVRRPDNKPVDVNRCAMNIVRDSVA